MHSVPLINLDFYKTHNVNNPEKPYKWEEMDEKEALDYIEKHDSVDPKFVSPKKAVQINAQKDAEINRLKDELGAAAKAKEELAGKEDEITRLREQLAKATQATQATQVKAAPKQPNA